MSAYMVLAEKKKPWHTIWGSSRMPPKQTLIYVDPCSRDSQKPTLIVGNLQTSP